MSETEETPNLNFVGTVRALASELLEATGFGHYYGGFESDSRIGADSTGQCTGREYTPIERGAKRAAAFGGLVLAAYLGAKHGLPSLKP